MSTDASDYWFEQRYQAALYAERRKRYTSGKTTHDPRPYVDENGGRHMWLAGEAFGMAYDPRPEFDNHNPILSDLRENGDIAGHLEFCTDRHSAGHYSTPLGKAQIAHATRVLTKLANVYKED